MNASGVNSCHFAEGRATAHSIVHFNRRFWHQGKLVQLCLESIWRPVRQQPCLAILYGLCPCLCMTLIGIAQKAFQPIQLLICLGSFTVWCSVELPAVEERINDLLFAIRQHRRIYGDSKLFKFPAPCLHNVALGFVVFRPIRLETNCITRIRHKRKAPYNGNPHSPTNPTMPRKDRTKAVEQMNRARRGKEVVGIQSRHSASR